MQGFEQTGFSEGHRGGEVAVGGEGAGDVDADDEDAAAVSGEITDSECSMEIKCAMTGQSAEAAKGASEDLDRIVAQYLDENPNVVDDYRKNEKAANRVIGFVMKQSGGSRSSAEVLEAVKRIIESRL